MNNVKNILDPCFFSEMMTHPALFAHPKPQKIAIIGNPAGVLQEVLKHANVESIECIFDQHMAINDPRVSFHHTLAHTNQDIIIQTKASNAQHQDYFNLLNADGILVQPCPNPLVQPNVLKRVYQQLRQVGFNDCQIMNFPQAGSPMDWLAIVMSTKCPLFKRIREKDIFNKSFSTLYYNFEIHQASLALPEFVRAAMT